MKVTPPRARRATLLAAIIVGSIAVLAPTSPATAADGPAPAPREQRVIAGVHTDAVATFLDGGRLALASKADVEEGNGTRFAAGDVVFHVADDAKVSVPAGYEFIAAAGSEVWIAPESNPGSGRLWPGFSTESVAAGAVEGDRTTFTLTGVEGPGSLELFTAAGVGGVKRLWSSDDAAVRAFTVGRTHMHANWAFTAAGTYRVGVEAAVTVAGQRQTAHATYTFAVGGLSAAVETATALTAGAASAVAGEPVALTATVSPVDAAGWVEFLDGATVLGHDAVSGGRASYAAVSLPLGSRSLTARFVPHVLNEYARSTSAPVTVTVTEKAGGDVFGITGLAARYTAGQQIDLGITGATPGEGDTWLWLLRGAGSTVEFGGGESDRFVRDATVALDGAQIKVQLRNGRDVVQETAWQTIHVEGRNVGTGAPITVTGLADGYYNGDPVRVTVTHRALADDETARWVARWLPATADWEPVYVDGLPTPVPGSPGTYLIDTNWFNGAEWAYEILAADGTVVGRSPAFSADIAQREVLLSGLRSVYRAGDTLRAESELFPARENVAYEWVLTGGGEWAPIPGATGPVLEMPVTADLDGKQLYLSAVDATTGHAIAGVQRELRVTDAAPGEQLLLLDSLSEHYHQGNAIKLSASADPVAGDTDTYRWLWKRPDQAEFTAIEGATAARHELRAEQALDGTQVRAELWSAGGELLAASEPATVHVDDHGAPPQQKVTIGGLADRYRAGEQVRLTADVAPASVLSRWEWHVRKAGAQTATVVDGQHGPHLSLTAAAGYDGATVVARLTFDDGRSYVESAPVTLRVAEQAGTVLSVSGMAAGEYQPGAVVTLQAVQSPQGPLTAYRWFGKRPGDEDFRPVEGETAASYAFTATGALHGTQYRVTLSDGDTVVATSEPVTLKVAAPQPGDDAAKTVSATISDLDGALVISVAPQDRAVTLPDAALNTTGDRWESTGALKPVTVTDTRATQPGWTAAGQVADGLRGADGTVLDGGYLGWTPVVVRQADRQRVTAGPAALPERPGLGDGAVLATAPDGAGRGTALLDATLRLSVPTDTTPGTYTGTLTLTVI